MVTKSIMKFILSIFKYKIFILIILSIIICHNGQTKQQRIQQDHQLQLSSQQKMQQQQRHQYQYQQQNLIGIGSSSSSSSGSISSSSSSSNTGNNGGNVKNGLVGSGSSSSSSSSGSYNHNHKHQQLELSSFIENQIRYDAPDDCHYWFLNKNDVSLICNLRTVNSDFDTTNFSVIPSDNTVSLTIICNDEILTKSSLYSNSFIHLIKLKELNIEYCKLSKFSNTVLNGLNDLRNLTIRTHNINWQELNLDIEINSFSVTTNLERLDLSQNNIWSLPDNIFCNLNGLIFLNMSENRLQDINELGFRDTKPKDDNANSNSSSTNSMNINNGNTISNKNPDVPPSSSSFNSQSSSSSSSSPPSSSSLSKQSCSLDLEILDVSYNHFVLLPANGFGILKRLKHLKLNNNEISMITDRALNGLKNLQILNLSSNKIVALPSELFIDTSQSIQEIYLQNNSISVLSPKLFSNLVQLQALDLSFNQITSMWIDKDTFVGLIRLVLLNLSHNKITKLKPEIFTDLYTLQILNLRYNQIENIESDTFSPMNNLHTLLLSHNKLKYLDAYALNGLYVLSLLSLDNNALIGVHPEAFRNCSSLQDLNLNGNQLKSIPLALRNMRLLRTVDLGENMISLLEEPGFRGLNNLYGLRLIGNYLENITIATFKDLPSLQILNLARNRIQYIEPGAFEMTSSIQAIRLDGNEINDVSGLFSNMPSLLWLNISDNKLEHFDFAQIPNSLQWLDLHKNELSELSNRYMLDGHLRLQTLDASFNHLTRVTPTSIPNSIELLFLNDNLISIVEPHSFLNKVNLTRVDLYANQITTLDIKALRLLPVSERRLLPEFYIGGNPFICDCNIDWLQKINQITTRQYPKIMDLETIYCKLLNNRERAYIQLIDAEPKNFLCTYKTHCFALCHCCEFDACDCEMTCPNNCTCFHDQSWSANVVECSMAGYEEMPTNIPMDTTEVYIDGNFLGELSGHSFIGRKNLIVLYANSSNIQTIYNTTFSGLRRLMILHLEDNKIYRLYGNEFGSLENLRELYLQNNKISYIANGTFSRMRKLEVLRLDGNKLVSFEIWQLVLNPYLVEIGLADNMWSCECSYLSKFRNYLQTSSQKIIDANRVACVYNNLTSILKEKNGTKCTLRDGISTYVRTSEIEDLLPLLLASTCAFIGFFGLILGVFCYRHELQMWAHSNCILSLCYKSSTFVNSYDKDRFYDAYITYSLQDEHFVNQILANTLENNIGYRLCLHYRDFNVNSYITDTIIEAVESSKQAVLVLSKNFLYNEWTRFEFKSAVHELLKRRKKLVFILYGDLPQRDIDADMRHYLRTNTCIEWDDKKFWQKLRIALPHIRKNHCLTKRSAVNIYATAHDYNNGPPPPPPPDCAKRFDCSNYATIKDCGRNFNGSRFDAVVPTTNSATLSSGPLPVLPSYKYNPSSGMTIADNENSSVHLQKNDLNSIHSSNTIDRKHQHHHYHHHEYAVPSTCLIGSNTAAAAVTTNYSMQPGNGNGGAGGVGVSGDNNCECCQNNSRYSTSMPLHNTICRGGSSNEFNQSLTNSISGCTQDDCNDDDVDSGADGVGGSGGVGDGNGDTIGNNGSGNCGNDGNINGTGNIDLNFSNVNNLCQNNGSSNNFYNNYSKTNNCNCNCNCCSNNIHNMDGYHINCNNHCNHCVSSPSLNEINSLEKRIQQNLWA